MSDRQVNEYIKVLFPVDEGATPQQTKNIRKLREDMKRWYF